MRPVNNVLARLRAAPEILDTEAMLDVFCCSRATLYREIRAGNIPRRVRFMSVSGWYRDDIIAALDTQRAESRRALKQARAISSCP